MSFSILNIEIDHFSEDQLETILRGWLSGWQQKKIVTPNAEMILAAQKDKEFQRLLNEADMVLPDSVSLRYAVAAQGGKFRFRHPGTDTVIRLARLCQENKKKILLFGAEADIAKRAGEELKKQFPGLEVVGLNPGVIKKNEDGSYLNQELIELINSHQPDVLAVALGQKRQEQFINEYLSHCPTVKMAIGIGGAFDMIAGVLPRAPRWFRMTGLEWLWRLRLQPKRIGRIYRAVIVFPAIVAYDTLKHGRIFSATKNVIIEVFRQLIGK